MYESHFGLSDRPFRRTPDPAYLFAGEVHAEALERLVYCAEETDLGLLTGDVGTGKTLLTRALADRLDGRGFHLGWIVHPRLSPAQLLAAVAAELGVDRPPRSRRACVEAIYARLEELWEGGVRPVVILDEAQLLPGREALEEIRLLTNFQTDTENLLGLILVGQPELEGRLRRPAYRAVAQRIGIHCRLEPLSQDDTGRYLAHRLRVAGREEPLFTEEAVASVHRLSGGLPRRINAVAEAALIEAYGQGAEEITAPLVEAGAKSLLFG
ncbi:ExeA family protein [Deferrisoma camini]|uniref:ExeA family protein n=1 Tax=Deferrisoma camini TaxID=1035120 RepID=UPI00046CB9D4|nr:AAA family ATPase [Deferrisoma camini]